MWARFGFITCPHCENALYWSWAGWHAQNALHQSSNRLVFEATRPISMRPDAMRPRSRPERLRPRPNDLASRPQTSRRRRILGYRSSGMAHRTQTAHVPQFTRRQRLVAVYYVILYVIALNCQLFEVWFDGVRLLFRLLQKLALLVMSWFRLKTKGSKDTLSEERVGSLGLAQYLSKRRKVDGQISALLLSFRKREESFTRQLNSTKQICEQKIADFETLIRELAHDRASLQLEKGKMIEYVEDAQNRYICFRSVLKATSINNRCLCRPVHNFCSLYKFQYPNLKKNEIVWADRWFFSVCFTSSLESTRCFSLSTS